MAARISGTTLLTASTLMLKRLGGGNRELIWVQNFFDPNDLRESSTQHMSDLRTLNQ